jgi:hypothetical protein
MPGVKPFLAGLLAGGCLSFAALQYHVVRADKGIYVFPRTPQPSLTLTYADVRDWSSEQWDRRPLLVDAIRADGATDLLHSDAQQVNRDELQDAMQRSLDDPVLLEADDEVDSGMIVNKPTHRAHDTINGIDDPVATRSGRHNNGFLDDVRSELDWSFGNQSSLNDHTTRQSGSFDYDIRDSRERMNSMGDDWHDDAFSDTSHDLDSSGGVESQQYVPAPKFDKDDEILNRFAPRSGASADWDSAVTLNNSSWQDDPWALTSHSTNSAIEPGDAKKEPSPGWTSTLRNSSAIHAIAGMLDRFNSVAGDAARETIDRTHYGVASPTEDRSNEMPDSTGNSIDELSFDEDGLYSPFTEVDD